MVVTNIKGQGRGEHGVHLPSVTPRQAFSRDHLKALPLLGGCRGINSDLKFSMRSQREMHKVSGHAAAEEALRSVWGAGEGFPRRRYLNWVLEEE